MQKYLHVWKEIDILHNIFKKISWPKYSVRFLFCNRLLFFASLTGVNGRRRVLLLCLIYRNITYLFYCKPIKILLSPLIDC
jgi:hypothetical protein